MSKGSGESGQEGLTTSHLSAATTSKGTPLEHDVALRRFLTFTHEAIHEDEEHLLQEAASDVFAFVETFHAGAEALDQSSADPLADNAFAIASAVAALYLVRNLSLQRAAKKEDFRKGLRMWVQFEQDLDSTEHGDTRDERRKKALANLGQKIRHSGLQFVNLPSTDKHFDKALFQKIAQAEGITGQSLTKARIQKAGAFLRAAPIDKLSMAAAAASMLVLKTRHASEFLWNTVGGALTNGFDFITAKLHPPVIQGYKDAILLQDDFKTVNPPDASDSHTHAVEKELTLQDIMQMTLVSIQEIPQFTDDERLEISEIMKDADTHRQAAKRARMALGVQTFFEAAAVGQAIMKIADGRTDTLWMNGWSFIAALGPLVGFAEELTRERGKLNSKLVKQAQRMNEILESRRDKNTPGEQPTLDEL